MSTAPFERPSTTDALRVGVRACVAALLLSVPTLAGAATLRVAVRGVETGGGRVFVSLCSGGLEPQDCPIGMTAAATDALVTFTFPDVSPGVYAVAAFQDRNGNGVLDKSRNGLPLEPYGFSNGTGRPTVPRFERAAFQLGGDADVVVRLLSIATRR